MRLVFEPPHTVALYDGGEYVASWDAPNFPQDRATVGKIESMLAFAFEEGRRAKATEIRKALDI